MTSLLLRLALALLAFFQAAVASAYPDKPIRIVVPFTAGSGNDTVGRVVAEQLRRSLKAQVVVENKAGAGGAIGTRYALSAPPDGYTLVMTSSATHSANPWLIRDLPYDPLKDFAHITNVITTPLILVVPQGSSRTLSEFLDKSRRGNPTFGFGSSTSQVFASAFASVGGFSARPIGYKSQPPALVDLSASQVDYMFADAAALAPFIQGERLAPLAITGAHRSSRLPDVPTLAQLGYKDFDLVVWVGLAAPAGTPPQIVRRLNQALREGLARQEVRDRFAAVGMEVTPNTPDAQRVFVQTQLAVWRKRIQEAGLQPQ